MIILRSIYDSADLMLGTMYTQFSLAIAYFVMFTYSDWDPVYFKPEDKFWRKMDSQSFYDQKVLFGLHLGAGLIVKNHGAVKEEGNIVHFCLLGALLWEVTVLQERQLMYNPLHLDEMNPDQIRSLTTKRLEYGAYLSAIGAGILYTYIRVFKGSKLRYPKMYESFDKNDFIIANLGQLETLCTIISPVLAGFSIYDFSPPALLKIIQIVAALQALIPFVASADKPKVEKVTKMASFVIIPVLNIILCTIFHLADEDKKFASFTAYTISIQVFLLLFSFFRRFGCK